MPAKSASSRVRSETEPGHLGRHDRRLGADHGHLRDAVLLEDVHGLGDRLARVGVHEVGEPAVLAAQHLADGLGVPRRPGDREAVLRQPLVVEDLGQVAAAGVRQQHDDDGVLALRGPGQLVGQLLRGVRRHPRRAADEQRLLAGQPTGVGERVGVRDLDDPVRDLAVVAVGPEVLADALDEVRAAAAAGVHRPGRVGADDLDVGVLLLEVAADAADRAAGADAAHEVGDLPVGLLPDLGTGRLVVGARVVRVGVLVGLPRAGLGGQPVGHVVVGVGVLGRDRGRADDDLGAVRLQHVALVLADLVGADEDALVALGLRDHGEAHAGVARRRLDDRAAGLELAGRLGRLDHPGGDAVLHGAAGVEVLDLREDHRTGRGAREIVEGAGQPQERGVADEVQERVDVLHPANVEVRVPDLPNRRASVQWPCGESRCCTQARVRRRLRGRRPVGVGGGSVRPPDARGQARPQEHRTAARRPAAGLDRLVRPRPPRPRHQDRAAR